MGKWERQKPNPIFVANTKYRSLFRSVLINKGNPGRSSVCKRDGQMGLFFGVRNEDIAVCPCLGVNILSGWHMISPAGGNAFMEMSGSTLCHLIMQAYVCIRWTFKTI